VGMNSGLAWSTGALAEYTLHQALYVHEVLASAKRVLPPVIWNWSKLPEWIPAYLFICPLFVTGDAALPQ